MPDEPSLAASMATAMWPLWRAEVLNQRRFQQEVAKAMQIMAQVPPATLETFAAEVASCMAQLAEADVELTPEERCAIEDLVPNMLTGAYRAGLERAQRDWSVQR